MRPTDRIVQVAPVADTGPDSRTFDVTMRFNDGVERVFAPSVFALVEDVHGKRRVVPLVMFPTGELLDREDAAERNYEDLVAAI